MESQHNSTNRRTCRVNVTRERLYNELENRVGKLTPCRREALRREMQDMNANGPVTKSLKQAIEKDQRTPCKIARDAGIDTAAMYRFLDGTRLLRADSIDALCQTLGLRLTPANVIFAEVPPEDHVRNVRVRKVASRKK